MELGLKFVCVSMAAMVALLLLPPAVHAAVYNVGDKAGWTTIGNPDYKQWAATKTFHVGDVVVFQYNPQFHNVMQVAHEGFKTCNASSPKATYTSGNDSITINRHGHYFFMCGVPGHCQSGQKVDIHVPHIPAPVMAPSPSDASPSPAQPATAMAPGPSNAAGATMWTPIQGLFCAAMIALAVF